MQKKHKIYIGLIAGTLIFALIALYVFQYTRLIDILAGAVGERGIYDLRDGDSLNSQEIYAYLQGKTPGIKLSDAKKFSRVCKEKSVNPALALGIARGDSHWGRYGAARGNLNPGNTKRSASALARDGVNCPSRGGSFAKCATWGDGFAAICATLGGGYYYSLGGPLDPILRVYAGNPNPNYYGAVRGVMNELLPVISISGEVVQGSSKGGNIIGKAKATLFRGNAPVAETLTARKFSFPNLARRYDYSLKVKSDHYFDAHVKFPSPHKNNGKTIILKERTALAKEQMTKTSGNTGCIEGSISSILLEPILSEAITLRAVNLKDKDYTYYTQTEEDDTFSFLKVKPGKYRVEFYTVLDPTGFDSSKEIEVKTRECISDVEFIL